MALSSECVRSILELLTGSMCLPSTLLYKFIVVIFLLSFICHSYRKVRDLMVVEGFHQNTFGIAWDWSELLWKQVALFRIYIIVNEIGQNHFGN